MPNIARARSSHCVNGILALPARFMLLAAYNPCPCGWYGASRGCSCDDAVRRRYEARLSGPMRDRIDLVVHLEPVMPAQGAGTPEATATVAERVRDAWARQIERQGVPNAELPPDLIGPEGGYGPMALNLLEHRGRQMALSLRRVHRAARVARTIADLRGAETVATEDVDEALAHRPKEAAA